MKQTFYLMMLVIGILNGNVLANQDLDSKKLLQRIHALEERITVLESRFTFATFMPDFAERFHVMHRASDAGDWAVASHELQIMKQFIALSKSIDAEKGTLLENMMGASMKNAENAINHANANKMVAAMAEMVQACNACHIATGSPFINVTLDATGSLSMRHPHRFSKQKTGSHTH